MTLEGSIQQRLEARFEVHHSKPGRGSLTYVTVEQVTSRLNEVLGWDGWDFKVKEHGYHADADSVWCLGALTLFVDGRRVEKEQFGGQKVKRSDGTKEILDFGDDMKGAASDALKKCAMAIGVGLYLSEKQGGQQQPRRQQQPQAVERAKPVEAAAAPVNNVRAIDQYGDCRRNGKFAVGLFISRMRNRRLTVQEIALVAPHASGNSDAMDPEGWLERNPDKTYYDLLDLAAAGGMTDEAVAR